MPHWALARGGLVLLLGACIVAPPPPAVMVSSAPPPATPPPTAPPPSPPATQTPQTPQTQSKTVESGAAQASLKPEELEQLVAPIALYPDPLLAQVLMASTYPLEVVQAARWADQNKTLKGKALEDAAQRQAWDPSVKSLVPTAQVLTMMNDKLEWTQKLGDAFLAQENDLMAAVQKLRARAKEQGNLETTAQQSVKLEDDPTSDSQVVVIEPADPEVVYVPTYDPMTVYGAWPYPSYLPYSWYPAGFVAAGAITFGVGVAMGAALWGGVRWGYRGGTVNINNVNNFNRVNRTNISSNRWQHDSAHRRGVQYRDGATAQRFNRSGPAGSGAREGYRGRGGTAGGFSGGASGASGRSSAFQGAGSSGASRQARTSSSRGSSSRSSFSGGSRMSGGMRGGGGRRR